MKRDSKITEHHYAVKKIVSTLSSLLCSELCAPKKMLDALVKQKAKENALFVKIERLIVVDF